MAKINQHADEGTAERFRLEDRVHDAHENAPWSLWKSTDTLLDRTVAVYRLSRELGGRPQVAATVRDAARVNDTRIARVFDADLDAARPYIVTEWAPGECLEDLLLTGPATPAMAAAIVADAAEALAAGHEAGCRHLCLTPRSLRWGSGGVKITGLGIQAALCGVWADDPAGTDTEGLARILYALLTGYWPGDDATALPRAPRFRGRLYAPRQVQAGIPRAIDEITVRALDASSLDSPALLGTALRLMVAVPRQNPARLVPRPRRPALYRSFSAA